MEPVLDLLPPGIIGGVTKHGNINRWTCLSRSLCLAADKDGFTWEAS